MKKLLLTFLIILFTLSFNVGCNVSDDVSEISYSQFIQKVKQGNVTSVKIAGSNVSGVTASGEKFETYSPGDLRLMGVLLNNGVSVEAEPPAKESFILAFLSSFGPFIAIILIIISIIVSRRKNRIENKDSKGWEWLLWWSILNNLIFQFFMIMFSLPFFFSLIILLFLFFTFA